MVDRRSFVSGLAGATAGALGGSLGAVARVRDAGHPLDVAYLNAKVWTGQGPGHRVDAIGVAGGRIAALGAGAVRARIAKTTRVVDLGGAFVVPGLTDAHTHFTTASLALSQPSLRDAANPQDFIDRIAAAARALPRGEWLLGGSWDADRWGGKLPSHEWIDAVTPDTPVAVIRYDLHMYFLNALAMKLAGIDRNTPDVAGGVIERDAAGNPTGIFKDGAKALVERAIAQPGPASLDAAVKKGIALALSKGVTQVHCPELDDRTDTILRRLRAAGETDLRFYSMIPLKEWEAMATRVTREGKGDEWVRWGACKVVFDGSLGSRTALFYEPYLDEPGTRGITVTDPADLERWMMAADKAGLQVAVHAIGDRANDVVLDTMARVAKANGPRDRRFRIEHAQHLRPDAIARFARQGVIASVQPYHAIDDGRWAIRRIGPERLKTTYAFESILKTGAHMALGSDWPVAPIDPLTGIAAAVLRETLDGQNPHGWYPEQKLTLEQALVGYTRGGAYAGFSEGWQGLLKEGWMADFAVFDRDLFAIDPETITQARALRTVVGGKERFVA